MDSDDLLIRPSAPEPIYRQIMEQLRRLIVSHQVAPGEPLPSVRDVAARHAINPMTVSRAYGLLEAEGLLERQRGKGMIVANSRRRAPTEQRLMMRLDPSLADVAREARELGLAPRLVLERLKYHLESASHAAPSAEAVG
ncbi:MAG TPA: GntR family transcriptional regulator [Steroidobacteraceae bacterium]|jgi:GntR family transcriptional regulator|nr:GntR family transcriptional regulator [Steroidobacteraceae bacterium]